MGNTVSAKIHDVKSVRRSNSSKKQQQPPLDYAVNYSEPMLSSDRSAASIEFAMFDRSFSGSSDFSSSDSQSQSFYPTTQHQPPLNRRLNALRPSLDVQPRGSTLNILSSPIYNGLRPSLNTQPRSSALNLVGAISSSSDSVHMSGETLDGGHGTFIFHEERTPAQQQKYQKAAAAANLLMNFPPAADAESELGVGKVVAAKKKGNLWTSILV
ncbi:hypothetical protein HK097_008958 [Rhizophlyctis rosea]|uniref:Uncharacterized protein n=1 Tax=Rhizophlyctis rosea TaxID=64517 RepID=A0AAD5SPS1_9FUNG|nr:hypothetical protein HK097_008958 [Rhizophlyctis rosea]